MSVLAVVASHAFSQEFRATVTGEVTDPSRAAVAGANVAAAIVERNVQRRRGREPVVELNPTAWPFAF